MTRVPTVLVQIKRCAKETGRTVAETIQYYAVERFLYRLGSSRYRDNFVLKGAMMFRAWDAASRSEVLIDRPSNRTITCK